MEIALLCMQEARGPSKNQLARPTGTLGKECPVVARVSDPLKVVLAVVFPPLGVFCEVGLTGHFGSILCLPCWAMCQASFMRSM